MKRLNFVLFVLGIMMEGQTVILEPTLTFTVMQMLAVIKGVIIIP